MPSKPEKEDRSFLKFYAMAFELVIMNLALILGGYYLDSLLKSNPMGILIGIFLGIAGTIGLLFKSRSMKKWWSLISVTATLIALDHFVSEEFKLHVSFRMMVLFFFAQTVLLFKLGLWVPKEWSNQLSLVKMVLRLLLSLFFIGILMYGQEDQWMLAAQFIGLYFIYMIFEIVVALTNLRRNEGTNSSPTKKIHFEDA